MKARMKLFIVAMLGLFILCPAASAVGDSNLVAHWQFDEGSGTIAHDSAGNNHGTIYGATWTTGIIGGALDFAGNGERVQVPDDDSLTPSDQITICLWAYNRDGWVSAVYKYASCPSEAASPGNSRAYGMALYEDAVSMDIFSAVNNYDVITSTNPLSLNEWHHVAGTFNKGQAALYVDGHLEISDTFTVSSIMNDAQPLIIGGFWDYCGTDNFEGKINGLVDDVRIYNKALSAEEIRQIYQAVVSPEIPQTYYVDGVNGNDLNNGLSPETAFATVQKGIDIAKDGNTVLVYPAVYSEAVDFLGKAITVQGVATAAGIAILENPGDFAVSFYNGEEPNSILKNFVIRNSFMAIFTASSFPTITNLTIVDNKYGIGAYAGAEPDISNCIFWNNTDVDLFGCQAQYSWVQDTEPQPLEGLVSRWAFDEGSGTIAHDSAGNYDGTVQGATWTTGKIGGALQFDGMNDYVALPINNPIWLPQNDFTLSAWVYFDKDPSSKHDFVLGLQFGYSGNHDFCTGYSVFRSCNDGMGAFQFATKDSDYGLSSDVLAKNIWYHITAVRRGIKQEIYLDGQLNASQTCSGDPIKFAGTGSDGSVNIGRAKDINPGGAYYLDGMIDDVRIYNRALSAEEIRQLFDGRNPLFADPANGDYHLRSERGRYWPQHDVWVLDNITSPCVDGGDPAVDPSGEPMPNGGRIDMGAYGGTPYASMSEWAIAGDTNRDGVVDFADLAAFCNEWLSTLPWAE